MLILNEETITQLTDPIELTDKMEEAMLSYANGKYVMPDRAHMDFDGNTLLMMPSACCNFFSTKLVSLFPNNPKNGDPVLFGTVILNDGKNGKPIAMLNGAKLTAVRTAAVGSVGVRHTSPENASTLGLIGAGVQGFQQILFACKNRPIKEVYVYDAFASKLDEFIKSLQIHLPDVKLNIAQSPSEICKKTEVIITATNATSPVLPDDQQMLKGKSIVAIGSYKPEMVELPNSLYPLLDNYFIDVDMAMEESGDLIHPINNGLVNKNDVHLLSEVINGNIKIDPKATSLYKSVGMALFDLFAASYLYSKAQEKGMGQEVNF